MPNLLPSRLASLSGAQLDCRPVSLSVTDAAA